MKTSDDIWKPAATAPKDGRVFLVCFPRMMDLVVRCSYSRVHKYFKTDQSSDGITVPTFFHEGDLWTDIPPLPQKQEKQPK